jgi:very-short-patch-repair endonuclease
MSKTNVCIVCNSIFEVEHKSIKTCSTVCSGINYKRMHEERRLKVVQTRSKKLMETGTENIDYVIDKWNGFATKRMYGIWFKNMHPGKTLNEYKKEFPGAPLACETDKKKTSKSSGLHMKEEKYKKILSERMKGENNINHTSKTTLEERQAKSPFSQKFVKYKDKDDKEKAVKDFAKIALKHRITETNKEYWINKTETLEEAEKLYKERQKTFSLEKCIEKHGEVEGTEIWNNRQKKWHKNFKKSNFSKVSQTLFHEIYNNIQDYFNDEDIFYATLNKGKINNEHILDLKTRIIRPDFFIKSTGKIIEFDGTYYHRNTPENNKREKERDNAIIKSGYKVLHVSESDYNKNPEYILQQCINFLTED